jgi:hypothetical protein
MTTDTIPATQANVPARLKDSDEALTMRRAAEKV